MRPGNGGAPRLVLGSRTLTGPAASVIALLLTVTLLGLVVWAKPSIGMWLAGGIWLGFVVFWNLTARRRRAPAQSEESRQSRALHRNLLNLGLLLLFVSIPGLRWRYLPPNPWHVPVGLGIMAAATLLHIWARVHLGRNWSHEVMIRSDHELVRTGPYRLVRHPIYTAILGLAIGTAVVSGRGLSLLGALVFGFAYVRKLRIEEHVLGEAFGTAWQDYRKRSWALVPLVF
jgi:protein-S-isoprenylcysteine O-methyltransferase Ste14